MKIEHVVLASLVALVALNGIGLTAQTGQAPTPALKPGPIAIIGKVVEGESMAPVIGATVRLTGPALADARTSVFADGTPGGPRYTVTDSQGQFLFRGLPAGSYSIETIAAGYLNGSYGQTRPGNLRPLDVVPTLDVVDADKLVSIRIQMFKKGGISGTVFDDAGVPLVGAYLGVMSRTTVSGAPSIQRVANVSTDDRGMYHVDVAPGDYVIAAFSATSTVPVSSVDAMQRALTDGGQALAAYTAQAGNFPIRGFGTRVGDFVVTRRDSSSLTTLPPVITSNNRLMMFPTTFHPSSQSATSANPVTVGSGEEKVGIDIRVPLVEARRVSGRVRGITPASGISLLLVADDPAALSASPTVILDTPQTVTDSNGDFTFVGVSPGSYIVRVARMDVPGPTPVVCGVESIVVPESADLADVQIAVHAPVSLTGRIAVRGAGKSLTPPQLRAITVRPRALPGTPGAILGSVIASLSITRSTDSEFVTPTLPGRQMVAVSGLPPGWVLHSVTANGQNVVDSPVDVPETGLTDVIVTISDQVSTLSGLVRDADGRPSASAVVAVFPKERGLWPPAGMTSRRVRAVAVGRDGRYLFLGLPSGDYLIAAVDSPAPDFSDSRVLSALVASAFPASMSDGDSKLVDLRLAAKR